MPLGVPSRLLLEALDLAGRLIQHPDCRAPVGRSVEREAGFILLGGLCFSLPPDVLMVCVGALLGLQGALIGLLCEPWCVLPAWRAQGTPACSPSWAGVKGC